LPYESIHLINVATSGPNRNDSGTRIGKAYVGADSASSIGCLRSE
jgi:hypothetical protein